MGIRVSKTTTFPLARRTLKQLCASRKALIACRPAFRTTSDSFANLRLGPTGRLSAPVKALWCCCCCCCCWWRSMVRAVLCCVVYYVCAVIWHQFQWLCIADPRCCDVILDCRYGMEPNGTERNRSKLRNRSVSRSPSTSLITIRGCTSLKVADIRIQSLERVSTRVDIEKSASVCSHSSFVFAAEPTRGKQCTVSKFCCGTRLLLRCDC